MIKQSCGEPKFCTYPNCPHAITGQAIHYPFKQLCPVCNGKGFVPPRFYDKSQTGTPTNMTKGLRSRGVSVVFVENP